MAKFNPFNQPRYNKANYELILHADLNVKNVEEALNLLLDRLESAVRQVKNNLKPKLELGVQAQGNGYRLELVGKHGS